MVVISYITRENCLCINYIKEIVGTQHIMLMEKCSENKNYFL